MDMIQADASPVVRPLRAPAAAGVAGLAFALLFTMGLVMLRGTPSVAGGDEGIAAWFASGQDAPALIACLYLAPFAGVAFLWFIAVVRDHIGEREDRFFATVFFGSGVLFVGLLFVTAGIVSSMFVGPRFLGQPEPTAETVTLIRAMSYSLMFVFATRAAALFILATATVGRKTGAFPGWFSALGYVSGLLLLVTVTFIEWIVLVLPAWVAVVSVFILRRERARSRLATEASRLATER